MSLICGEQHPERPTIHCDHRPGNHPLHCEHSGLDLEADPLVYVNWPNLAYVAPPRKADAATGAELSRLAARVRAARGG